MVGIVLAGAPLTGGAVYQCRFAIGRKSIIAMLLMDSANGSNTRGLGVADQGVSAARGFCICEKYAALRIPGHIFALDLPSRLIS